MKILQSIGGIGSQMAAYATYLALKSYYKNEKVYYDTHFFDEKIDNTHNGEELNRVFGIKEENIPKFIYLLLFSKRLLWRVLRKFAYLCRIFRFFFNINYNFDAKIFSLKGNQIIFQTWTSVKYFESVRQQLNYIFKFPDFKPDEINNIEVLKSIKMSNSVSIHIRRGDYVGNPILGELIPISYYEKALRIIQKKVQNPRYFVFSDDSDWAKDNIKVGNCIYVDWNKGFDSYKDMQLMSMCKHNIIPNSSFSWWAALLNQNPDKIVINPKVWSNFDGVLMDMSIQDNNWIVIDNID
jgi:hypothetical protein